jgi:hypothetical protein
MLLPVSRRRVWTGEDDAGYEDEGAEAGDYANVLVCLSGTEMLMLSGFAK